MHVKISYNKRTNLVPPTPIVIESIVHAIASATNEEIKAVEVSPVGVYMRADSLVDKNNEAQGLQKSPSIKPALSPHIILSLYSSTFATMQKRSREKLKEDILENLTLKNTRFGILLQAIY